MTAQKGTPPVPGWRIGSPLHRADNGNVVIPLRITDDGATVAEAPMELSPAEAEILHAQLCRVLDGQPVPKNAPECRHAIQGEHRRVTGG
jgi:hypothetical protein